MYELYGLTEEEIAIVEGAGGRTDIRLHAPDTPHGEWDIPTP